MNTDIILKLITEIERSAGKILLEAEHISVENKTDRRNVVTEFDRQIQNMIVTEIRESIPEAGFFCEESDSQDLLSGDCVFVIDPIDGTMNFVHGLKCSCISIACLSNGIPTVAAVYNPYLDELFSAVRDKGAFLNGRPIHSADTVLAESVVSIGTSPYRPDLSERTFSMAKLLFDNSLDIRRSGSAELDLCSVAAGRTGFYLEQDVSLWDYAAGFLIAREAGAVCLNAEGEPLPWSADKTSVAAGTTKAMDDYLRLINAGA